LILTCFDKEGMGMYRVISGRFLQRGTELLLAIDLEITVVWDVRPRGMICNSRGRGWTCSLELWSSAPISSMRTLYFVTLQFGLPPDFRYTKQKKIYKVRTPTNALFIQLDNVLKFTLKITSTCSYMFRSMIIIRDPSLEPS